MLSSLSSLFRPKWQSPNSATRCRAIAQLNPASVSACDTLSMMVMSDPSAEVRLHALQKLSDPELLKRISGRDPDPAVQAQASRKLCELITNNNGQLDRQRLLELMEGVKQVDLLIHIALNAPDTQVRCYAVSQLEDQQALEQIVLFSNDLQLRLKATKAIDESERLQRLLLQVDSGNSELQQLLQLRLSASLD